MLFHIAAAPSSASRVFTLCLQAAATTRLRGKPDIFDAVQSGDLALVWDHLAVDASCIGRRHPSFFNR
jgi:hypothetical protein